MVFSIGVRDEEFLSWLKTTKNNFLAMSETMKQVADNIGKRVQRDYVPIETGRLSRSYKWTVLADNSRMHLLQVQMSALNPDTGYDYAWIQHEAFFNHDNTDIGFYHYTKKTGLNETGYETTDLGVPYDLRVSHHGHRRYLYQGIFRESSEAFELIEKDYLSLFMGEHLG